MAAIIVDTTWQDYVNGFGDKSRRPDLSFISREDGGGLKWALTADQPANPAWCRVRVEIDGTPPSAVISVAEFKKRAAMLWIRLADKPAAAQSKWDRIDRQLLSMFSEIHLTDQTVYSILGLAVKDGLLSADEVTAILQH